MFHRSRRAASRPLIAVLAVAGTALATPALATTVLAGPAQAATAPHYTLTLNPIANTDYTAINNNGDIIGDAPGSDGFQTAALFKAGSTSPLLLNAPADQAADDPLVTAEALNNADQVVGESDTGDFTALEWPDSSTPTDLSQLPPLPTTLGETQATSINDNGLIVGYGQNVSDADTPFTIQNKTVTTLPVLPSGGFDAQPIAVSDTGIIVGQADTSTQDFKAVEWVSGKIKRFPGLSGTLTSEALAVNDSGQAVGAAVLSDDNAHPVLWASGKATELHFGTDSADSSANDINDSGVVVGDGSNGDAFVYQNGSATDLNTLIPAGSGVTLTTADGINNNGDIVGTAVNAQGEQVGYELTPVG